MSQPLRAAGEDDPLPAVTEHDAPRPYGLLGLVISLVLIFVGGLLLAALFSAGALASAIAFLSWDETVRRLATLRAEMAADPALLQRAGVIVSIVIYAAITLAVLAAARIRGGHHWRGLLGWRPWHPLRGAALFWIVTVATIAYGFIADMLVAKFYPPSRDWVTAPAGATWIALFVFLAIVLAPITEEVLFRGWIYTSLRAKIGVWAAILLSAVLFAVAHWEKTHLYALIVFPVGLALGFVRERMASLRASMSLHALFNGAASLALLFGQ